MSLQPPNPIVMSKMQWYLKKKLSEDEFKSISSKIGPFPVFKLTARFRKGGDMAENAFEYENIAELVEQKVNFFDDIDVCLNMYTRLKNKLKDEVIQDFGFLRLSVQWTTEDDEKQGWNDMYLDEHPINCEKVEPPKNKELDNAEKLYVK